MKTMFSFLHTYITMAGNGSIGMDMASRESQPSSPFGLYAFERVNGADTDVNLPVIEVFCVNGVTSRRFRSG